MNREHRGENIEKEVFTQIKKAKKKYCIINRKSSTVEDSLKGIVRGK